MHKKWWCLACLGAMVAGGGAGGLAKYAFDHPDSLVGRCGAKSLEFGCRYNPLLGGLTTAAADMVTAVWHSDETAASEESCDFERPEEPCAVEEQGEPLPCEPLKGLIALPLPRVPAIVIAENDDERLAPESPPVEFPGAEDLRTVMPRVGVPGAEGLPPPLPPVLDGPAKPGAATGRAASAARPYNDDERPAPEPPVRDPRAEDLPPPLPPVLDGPAGPGAAIGQAASPMMPYCEDDSVPAMMPRPVADEEPTAPQCAKPTTVESHSFFSLWLGFFASQPSQLDRGAGSEESSEPMEGNDPSECKEDPNHHYHHSGCPFTGVCPYTGRSYHEPAPAVPQEMSGEAPQKHHKHLPKIDDGEEGEEDTPIHPEVDTMEFRPSDHSLNESGPPNLM